MKVKSDLHNHFRTLSNWKKGDFNRAVNQAERKLGRGAIIGLINFSDNRFETFYELSGYERELVGEKTAIYVPERDILIVKGQEVPTKQGHLLSVALPFGTTLNEHKDLEDTLKESNDHNASNLGDHPFYKEGIGNYLKQNPQLLEEMDAIETHNGEAALSLPKVLPSRANPRALEFYNARKPDSPNLGAYATSDGHSFREIGSSYTLIEKPSLESLQNDLRTALQNARPEDQATHNSYFGAIQHLAILAPLIIKSKITNK